MPSELCTAEDRYTTRRLLYNYFRSRMDGGAIMASHANISVTSCCRLTALVLTACGCRRDAATLRFRYVGIPCLSVLRRTAVWQRQQARFLMDTFCFLCFLPHCLVFRLGYALCRG